MNFFAPVLVGLLPVIAFLGALLYFDSYKLVKLPVVLGVVAGGTFVAGASYLTNGELLASFDLDMRTFARYVSPLTEELLKGLIIVIMIRMRRIGFLVDGAIFGFAVGTGFAVIENTYFFLAQVMNNMSLGTWIIRGFGTAIMHGGTTAIFALTSLNFLERRGTASLRMLMPGYLLAVGFHSLYNHALLPPIYSTLVVIITLPLLLRAVFQRSEKSIGDWLGRGFDADAEMLALINSGKLTDSPLGRYLSTLKNKFHGPIIADILCYVRLHTELALRAKGLLMMRESGFDMPMDDATKDKFSELKYLEKSIGRTGRMAIQPMLHMSHKDLWQLYMLKE